MDENSDLFHESIHNYLVFEHLHVIVLQLKAFQQLFFDHGIDLFFQ